jgi:CheY-like chemotaxis protein
LSGTGVLKVDMRTMEADADFVKLHPDLRSGGYVMLSVSDSGCGMDRATQDRVFDPFFTTKAVGEGTGLGLAVVHGIMRSHEGAVTVYSQPGEGTTFHLYFPVLASKPEVLEKEITPIPHGHGEHILYVDDERPLAQLGRLMLERLGYIVTVTTNPLEAIAAVREHPGKFDLVITDLTMPVMDGISLGRQLQLLQPRLRMILTTGYSGLLTTEKVREMGFLELLDKPVNARALGELVDQILRQPVLSGPII